MENNFGIVQKHLEEEAKIQEEIQTILKRFDLKPASVHLASFMKTVADGKPDLIIQELSNLIPVIEELAKYPHKYRHLYDRSLQQWLYIQLIVNYIQSGGLLFFDQILDMLPNNVLIEIDDYLHAVVSLVNELARFAVVSVISGDYERPVAINQFIGDIFTNFQLLNLKNDSLRRRFDSLKYDAKKVEEVVYNLKLRKLIA